MPMVLGADLGQRLGNAQPHGNGHPLFPVDLVLDIQHDHLVGRP